MTKLSELTPDLKNANRHTKRGDWMLEEAVGKHGSREAGTLDKHGSIVGGNLRQEIYGRLGLDEIQIVKADPKIPVFLQFDDLDLEDPGNPAREIGLALNRIAQVSIDFDPDVLAALAGEGVPLEEMFSEKELDAMGVDLGGEAMEDPGAEIDRAEELREKWGVKLGDLWQVGVHKLACGDCTDAAVVERMMGGERISLIVTDPPYGVDYEGGSGNTEKRDKLEGDNDTRLYSQFLKVAPVDKVCAVYMWHAGRRANDVYQAAIEAGYTIRSQIIWHKLKAHYGAWMAQYKQKHEPCVYCVKGAPEFTGATNEVTVWEYDQPSKNEYHPTEKPLELMERAIGNHPYEQVYDPFLGSGTTLIACERLGRKCRAIEISPKYVAVCLERYFTMTGDTPELLPCLPAT